MLPSCLPTCTRERGHAKGCPVKAAEDAGVSFDQTDGPSTAVPQGLSRPMQPPPQPALETTLASQEWGRAAAEVISAKGALERAMTLVATTQERLAKALSVANTARIGLDIEIRNLLDGEK